MTRTIALLIVAVAAIFGAAQDAEAQQDLAQYLPKAGEAAGWKPDGTRHVYRGEDLYTYIDGGAEIYHEYGFRQVLVQDYRDSRGKTLSLEIFEMVSPEQAFGIYSFKTGTQGSEAAFGNGGRVEAYYLNFWAGSLLVTVTGGDTSAETRAGVTAVARAVHGRVKPSGSRPALTSLLPPAGQVKGSLKYMLGQLALYNSYPFSSKNVFRFASAVRADYVGGHRLFLFEYATAQEAATRVSEAQKALASLRGTYREAKADGAWAVSDTKGKLIVMRTCGRHGVLVLGARDTGTALRVLKEVEARLPQS